MRKPSFIKRSLLLLMLGVILTPFVDVNALLQEAGTITVNVISGEKKEIFWILQSDDDSQITVNLSSEGYGSEFLSLPVSMQIEPNEIVQVPIQIRIPADYSGPVIVTPTLIATKLGDPNQSTVINLQLAKTITISISNANVSSEPIMAQDETPLPKEEIILPQKEETIQDDQVKATVDIVESEGKKSAGCLIATATYGSELAPQVQILREVRDGALFNTHLGTAFMAGFNEFYYVFSPTISDWERQNPTFKESVKIAITPMIFTLSLFELMDNPSETQLVTMGVGVVLLNIGVYFAAPAFIINKLRNKF